LPVAEADGAAEADGIDEGIDEVTELVSGVVGADDGIADGTPAEALSIDGVDGISGVVGADGTDGVMSPGGLEPPHATESPTMAVTAKGVKTRNGLSVRMWFLRDGAYENRRTSRLMYSLGPLDSTKKGDWFAEGRPSS
jgi:hypothetical protein